MGDKTGVFADVALPHVARVDLQSGPEVRTTNGWLLGWPYMGWSASEQRRLTHLWAAAPELEAALGAILGSRVLARVPCDECCDMCVELVPLIAAGQAALFKAKGLGG